MTLIIQDLNSEVIIGILPFEREKPQKIHLNIELEYAYRGEYINYVEVVDLVLSELKERKYGLLEEALEDLTVKLKTSFPQILSSLICIKKLEILTNCIVGAKKRKLYQS